MTRTETYVPVVGLEIHAELLTKTKLFCGCSTRFGEKTNTRTCPVCLGMPGTYPVLNREALRQALRCAVLLNCSLAGSARFDRKNYLYPDLSRGYQISQFHLPLGNGGYFDYYLNGASRRCTLDQIHLEDDAGKIHYISEDGQEFLEVDYNRSGIPLVEIVTTPCFSGAEEVIAFTELLQRTLADAGICDGKIQEGSLRVDVNLSVRLPGETALRTRCEIKNLSSFGSIRRAIELETERQVALYEQGKSVTRQTLRYDEDQDRIFIMRTKEDARDYRYFPDPDLPVVDFPSVFPKEEYTSLPETPFHRIQRYRQSGLSFYDANLLASNRQSGAYFDRCLSLGTDPKLAANYLLTTVRQWEKGTGTSVDRSFLTRTSSARYWDILQKNESIPLRQKKSFRNASGGKRIRKPICPPGIFGRGKRTRIWKPSVHKSCRITKRKSGPIETGRNAFWSFSLDRPCAP
ncbi:MAG: Asp-tRNA(Asn)/Glu-tRNA(Gln) amidotransferase subunit GatB [Clostridia bacterium]|nr:Asp-tRNA(Asn)/Glu-tRNA(Gln) amidotransferase subunit GatB [Clostridia bacterium]